ncbi:hypothetical protein VCUG_02369 [Vavraia culicis subsp. floridensis]|uniref:Uncharacterized protein n=1 Tax=Vavraia culicis (isolate floridensis) TaxID=948595 RepID=L2GR77_VAVCU|nr:uncharacterized protein VCUG_02369 [Vavraia culicis subsp. floridensis]ELA46134.1 hypothetical protein VCUG_02369 [Vavraia culicis subsp. floridensis]
MFLFISLLTSKLIELHFLHNDSLVLGIDTLHLSVLPLSKAFQQALNTYCTFAQLRKISDNHYEVFYCGMKVCVDREERDVAVCTYDELESVFRMVVVDDDKYMLESDGRCVTYYYGRVGLGKCDGRDEQVFVAREGGGSVDGGTIAEKEKIVLEVMDKNEEYYRRESLKGIGRK